MCSTYKVCTWVQSTCTFTCTRVLFFKSTYTWVHFLKVLVKVLEYFYEYIYIFVEDVSSWKIGMNFKISLKKDLWNSEFAFFLRWIVCNLLYLQKVLKLPENVLEEVLEKVLKYFWKYFYFYLQYVPKKVLLLVLEYFFQKVLVLVLAYRNEVLYTSVI